MSNVANTLVHNSPPRGVANTLVRKSKKKRHTVKIADEHTGEPIWKGRRVTKKEWQRLRERENRINFPMVDPYNWVDKIDRNTANALVFPRPCCSCGEIVRVRSKNAVACANCGANWDSFLGFAGGALMDVAQADTIAARKSVLPPGIATSDLTNQVDWLTQQMMVLASVLRLPQDKTISDLVAHAKKMMRAPWSTW